MSTYRYIEPIRAVAARQANRISWAQTAHLGFPSKDVVRLIDQGVLIPRLPRVYAVGSDAPSYLASLWEAILFAGPGAMLSHGTAAHWRGLLNYAVGAIHVSTARYVRKPVEGIIVHARRRGLVRELHKGLPVTTVEQTLLDLAATEPRKLVRHALAQLDYERELDFNRLEAATGNGKLGSAELRAAMLEHDPSLARLNGPAEETFYELCVAWDVTPLPEPNVSIEDGVTIDSVWWREKLAAEVDGGGNHHSPAQRHKDAYKAIVCRRHGLQLLRYTAAMLDHEPLLVREDLLAQLARARQSLVE